MEKNIVVSPMRGEVKKLSESKDALFAQGLSGEGVLIKPSAAQIVAPFDGQVVLVFDTKHAIIIRSDDGLAMVIHIGVDIHKLDGNGFRVYVENAQHFHKGELLMEIDFNYLKQIDYDVDTHILFPSLGRKELIDVHYGPISFMEKVLVIK